MGCLGDTAKLFNCKIILLDGTDLAQEIKSDALAQKLLDGVFQFLNMIETVYFGLRYVDGSNQTHWLDAGKKICRQLKGNLSFTLYFGVKFYSSDPCKLLEEITRYQFFLQIKQDILHGRLPVSFDDGVQLCAYAVQSELGDYDPRRHCPGYISELQLLPGQTREMEDRISQIHKTLTSQLPAVAEMNFLDKAKWLEMYGVDLHPVLGEDNIEYFLGLTPNGVIVLRNKTKVGNYFWPRITKVYFKGRYFMLRVRDKNNDENTYGFELPTKVACKHLWKCCVEHHGFFRLTQVNGTPVRRSFRLSSKFQHSGRNEFQNRVNNDSLRRPQQPIRRVPSQRSSRRLPPTDGIDNSVKDLTANTAAPVVQQSCTVNAADSPRSTRSAPWGSVKQSKGLYSSSTNPSPRSLRCSHNKHRSRMVHQSSSMDSESSCDGRQHGRRHSSGHLSDASKSSRRSRSKSWQKKSRHKDRGSDSDFGVKHRRRRALSAAISGEFVDGEWCRIEQQSVQLQNAVIKDLSSRRSGYMNSGLESESEVNYSHRKKNRRHNRNRSPSDSQRRFPDELRRHFQYIDSSGLSEEQLKDIPYTRVETNSSRPLSVRRSPSSSKSRKGILTDGSLRSARSNVSRTTYSLAESHYSCDVIGSNWVLGDDINGVSTNGNRHEMSTEL